ncbi:MAG: hypothetical protein ABI548_12390 [Polyangiaceae bacterium]
MLLVVTRIPAPAQARVLAAEAMGVALADLNRRLAGILPRVLLSGLGADAASAMVPALTALGFGLVTCDPSAVPCDRERVLVKRVEFEHGNFIATDALGQAYPCSPSSIELLQRGTRSSTSSEKVTTTERSLDLGRAVLSGGLLLTKKTEKTAVQTTRLDETFLLLQRGAAGPDLMLYERRIDYRALGREMQPVSRGNFELVWAKLKVMAGTRVDDRVSRTGFVSGLLVTAADPIDLALHLVALDRRTLG